MKRNFEKIKLCQLLLYILITVYALYSICTDHELYQLVGRHPSIRTLCILLWLCLGLSFAGILWDFTRHAAFKRQYRELDQAVYSDPVAGIANRFSCDAVIEKYADGILPNHIGCIILNLTNISSINEVFGHARGNFTLRVFADILSVSAAGICFVGRNGGNKFLAIFEDCTEPKIESFLSNVRAGVEKYNADPANASIEYNFGVAFREDTHITRINQLIAAADRKSQANA